MDVSMKENFENTVYSAYIKSTPPFQNFHLLLPYSLELNFNKPDFSHLYLHIITHNFQMKNKFHKKLINKLKWAKILVLLMMTS